MRQNHYDVPLLNAVADLTSRPPRTPDELTAWWIAAGMVLDDPAGPRDVIEVRAYLARWAELVDADSERHRVQLLNALLADYTTPPVITDHGGMGWHIHHREDGLGMGGVLRAATSIATAVHLCERGMHRLGRCARVGCGHAFVDFSRGGRQRYCGRACANRDAVRRHRDRRSGTSQRATG